MKNVESAKGIGLENLQRRLELLYPGKHRFSAEKRSHSFFAEMQLEI
jgi:LytS/YehU family sensor histidine kinase